MGRPKIERDADQAEVAKQFKVLPSNYLDCRDPGLRHQWEKENDFHVIKMSTVGPKKIEALGRSEVCLRCGTVKEERFVVGVNGMEKVGQTYTYPEGYTIPGIPRGVKRSSVVWQENFRRAMEHAAGAARGERETAER